MHELATLPPSVIGCSRFVASCLEDSVKAPRQPFLVCLSSLLFAFFLALAANAQQIDPKTYGGMKWRLVAPFPGGRAPAMTGAPSHPNTQSFWPTGGGGLAKTRRGRTVRMLPSYKPGASFCRLYAS